MKVEGEDQALDLKGLGHPEEFNKAAVANGGLFFLHAYIEPAWLDESMHIWYPGGW